MVTSLLLVVVLFSALGRTGNLEPVQNLFLIGSSPLSSGLSKGFKPLVGFFKDIGQADNLRKENTYLKQENEQLRNKNIELEITRKRIIELEQALKIRTSDLDTAFLAATVIGFIQLPFRAEISINLGSVDGIQTGNIVLSPQGSLVGRITSVTKNYSFVRLVTDSRSRIASQVLNSTTSGIISGKPTRELEFDLVIGNIKTGDILITSGLGGIFPADIPVGVIEKIAGTDQTAFPQITVTAFAQITNLRTVLVDTSFIAILPEPR